MIPQLIEKYVNTGKVRFVHREFPLNSIHPAAQKAAEAAECAGRLGKFWEMSDKLFADQATWSAQEVAPAIETFKKYAQEVGVDSAAFAKCIDNGETAMDIQADLMAGEQLGVSGTPSFYANDIPLQAGMTADMMGTVIDYLSTGAEIPEILPSTENYHLLGNRQTAKAATVAFVDYASADSRQHALEVLPKLKETYIDTGKLLYMVHPWSAGQESASFRGALAAECGGQQNKFWEMHSQLFTDQANWTQAADPKPLFVGYASTLGLDTAKFEECLGSQWATLQVQAGNVVAALYGVPGAPTFMFNNRTGKEGSPTFDEFKTTIDSILNQ